MRKNHGLRHLYAQQRYLELTGKQCPAVQRTLAEQARLVGSTEGGWFGQVIRPIPALAPDVQHAGLSDREARQILTEELGHDRIGITNSYLGSSRD